jgi:hypothetical protein
MDRARSLPYAWRRRYLEAIADELLPLDNVNDTAVATAIDCVLRRIGWAA